MFNVNANNATTDRLVSTYFELSTRLPLYVPTKAITE